jgi:hypothetical protein
MLAALDDARARCPGPRAAIDALVSRRNLCAVGAAEWDLVDHGGFVEWIRAVPAASGAGLRAFGVVDENCAPGAACAPTSALQTAAAPPAGVVPTPLAVMPPTDRASPAPPPLSSGLNLGGRVSAAWQLARRGLVNASGQWTYWRSLFVRGSIGYRKDFTGVPFQGTYFTFGAGWDNWRPNSFSLQINHWEQFFPDQGLDARRLQVSADYKFARLCMGSLCAAPMVYLESPVKWDIAVGYVPIAGTRLTVTLRENLFVMLGLGVTLRGPLQLLGVYTAGRASWRPWTWNAIYENWGPNPMPQTNPVNNGQVSVGANWGF